MEHQVGMVVAAFGLGAVVGEPTVAGRGAMGVVWRVETTAGRWAVKIAAQRFDDDRPDHDVRLQEAAAAQGVPIAAPCRTADGLAMTNVGGTGASVATWIDFDPALHGPVSVARAAEVGRLVGTVHAVAPVADAADVDPWYTVPPTSAEWDDLVARAAGRPWVEALRARADVLVGLTRPPPSGPLRLCHNDLNPENVVPKVGAGPLVVLDWDNVGAGWPEAEVASALEAWATGPAGVDDAAALALLGAYADARGEPAMLGPEHFSSAAFVNFVATCARCALEPEPRSEQSEFHAEVLARILASDPGARPDPVPHLLALAARA